MSLITNTLRKFASSRLKKQCGVCSVPVRWLNLQEYQSKGLMADHEITVQRFRVVSEAGQAEAAAEDLAAKEYVVKAQILAGGRGKGVFSNGFKGGVHLTKDIKKVTELVKNMIGHKLVTKQTSKTGVSVGKVMIAEALDIDEEKYFAILMDRKYNGPVMVGSPQGGMDIEEVAEKQPDAIFTEPIDIATGMTDSQATNMAKNLGFQGDQQKQAATQIKRLYQLFLKVDASQVEINPFGLTPQGQVICFDAKISFDDNAAFRQQHIFALEDNAEMDPREVAAADYKLNYIGMEGSIGCLVNGAGLAMATMDIIKLHGGSPANFLDVGGGVTEQQVIDAFKLLTSDSQVKAILVNIFGGIVNCATIANGITNACKTINLKLPLVVRLEGMNVEEARRILTESNLPITAATDFGDAAQKVVASLSR